MSKETKYYFYSNKYQGERYFKVEGNDNDVLQIITKVTEKKGRAYCIGVTYIKYITFIGSWGWKLSESKNIKEIKRKEFDKELKKMIDAFKCK